MASPSPSNDERTSRNVRQRTNEPNVEPENKKATWIAIASFNKERKEVKLKWRNNTVSEFMDPATSFDTAGAFQRLVEHLEKAANEKEDDNDDEELEAWIADLTRLQKEYERLEAMDHVMDQERAFCCSTCRCTEDENMIDNIRASEDSLYHRFCCHNIKGSVGQNWLSDYDKALRKCEALFGLEVETGSSLMASTVEKNYRKAWEEEYKFHCNYQKAEKHASWVSRKEVEERNSVNLVNAFSLLHTNEAYNSSCKEYVRVKRSRQTDLSLATVLELFGGVGTGILTLKKIGVDMEKVISVEHDKIATHVMRYNHDPAYNQNLSDSGVTHVQYVTFESLFDSKRMDSIDDFMGKHGPIDIVIGGPPCQDFSRVNANRQGTQGAQGSYLPQFGRLIKLIKESEDQGSHPLFFLAENVVLEFDDVKKVEVAFGCTPIMLDAQHFSPTRRNRHYWTNFQLDDVDFQGAASKSVASSCLDKGWSHPAVAWADANNEPEPFLQKANTFMASKARLDDQPRMMKIKEVGHKKFEIGSFSASERERLLGYPEGYVTRAVDHLYEELLTNGYSKEHMFGNPYVPWKDSLDSKFHHFSGYPPRYTGTSNGVELMMCPPQTGKNSDFYNKEDYAKHLLGNAFSIPVVEHLLKPLACLFKHREYDGFVYKYTWEN